MTEVDAGEMAQLDAHRLQKKLTQGAMPQEISNVLSKLLRRRVHDMETAKASKSIDAFLAEPTPPTSTFSEHLVAHTTGALKAAMRYLPPEDSRALLLWLVGPAPEQGVLLSVIQMIGESAGVPFVQAFQGEASKIMDSMKQMDEQLFGHKLAALNESKRNIINGMLLDAKWAAQEGDGTTARNHIVRARKLAMSWLKSHQERQRMGWT